MTQCIPYTHLAMTVCIGLQTGGKSYPGTLLAMTQCIPYTHFAMTRVYRVTHLSSNLSWDTTPNDIVHFLYTPRHDSVYRVTNRRKKLYWDTTRQDILYSLYTPCNNRVYRVINRRKKLSWDTSRNDTVHFLWTLRYGSVRRVENLTQLGKVPYIRLAQPRQIDPHGSPDG